MRIAFVTSYLSRQGGGGVITAVEALSCALEARGLDVSVLGLKDEAWEEERANWEGATVQGFPVMGPRSLGRSDQLRRALLGGGYDLVHTHGIWTHTSADVAMWARRRGGPYLVAPHGMLDSWALSTAAVKKRVARMLYEDRHLRGAVCLQALCDAEARSIRDFGLTQSIFTIPNGVVMPEENSSVSAPWADRIPHDRRVLLYLGRLHPKKNLVNLIRAIAAIKSAAGLGNWSVAIAGWDQGDYQNELIQTVQANGVVGEVAFLGPLRGVEKDAAFRNASAFVLPSLSEGLPMAVLEAWAYGLPVAMTAACNIPRGFTAGAAVRINISPKSMAEDLMQFLAYSPSNLRKMGQIGRRLATEEFSWAAMAAKLQDVYIWALNGGPAADCVASGPLRL